MAEMFWVRFDRLIRPVKVRSVMDTARQRDSANVREVRHARKGNRRGESAETGVR